MIIKENIEGAINSPKKIANVLRTVLDSESKLDQDKEHFWTIGLNSDLSIKYIDLISLGILDKTIAHPREIFRLAILQGIKSIIIAHNHPSGKIEFSAEDLKITKQIKKAGEIVGINMLDHLIVTKNSYNSYIKSGV